MGTESQVGEGKFFPKNGKKCSLVGCRMSYLCSSFFPGFWARILFLAGACCWCHSLRAQDTPTSAFNDPVVFFNQPNEYAVAAGVVTPTRADSLLRGGPAVRSPAMGVWITGDTGEDTGRNYLEGGVCKEFRLREHARFPVAVTIPVTMAVGDEEYMFGPHFGYISAGINVRTCLSFIPSRYGRWTAGTTADFCYYGTSAAEFMQSIGLPMPRIAAVLTTEF